MPNRNEYAWPSDGPVRWGIIGCGNVTEVKSGPAFARVPHSTLSAVMRRDAGQARGYAERHRVPRWTTDADAIIDADDVDAVYVATPPASHAEYVLRVAAAGKPVYVEKPMSSTLAEAEAMVRACDDAAVPLFVAYYRRALPRFTAVRDTITEGVIGAPRVVQLELHQPAPAGRDRAGWRWDPAIAGGGLVMDVGSHALDLLDQWLGPITEVHPLRATHLPWSLVEDQVVAAFRFASGVHGVASWSFSGMLHRDVMSVVGTAGRVSVPLLSEGPIVVDTADGRREERLIPHPQHVQEPLITTIVAAIRGRGSCPSDGRSALRTQRVLEVLVRG